MLTQPLAEKYTRYRGKVEAGVLALETTPEGVAWRSCERVFARTPRRVPMSAKQPCFYLRVGTGPSPNPTSESKRTMSRKRASGEKPDREKVDWKALERQSGG
jgi:hypothetical protein